MPAPHPNVEETGVVEEIEFISPSVSWYNADAERIVGVNLEIVFIGCGRRVAESNKINKERLGIQSGNISQYVQLIGTEMQRCVPARHSAY